MSRIDNDDDRDGGRGHEVDQFRHCFPRRKISSLCVWHKAVVLSLYYYYYYYITKHISTLPAVRTNERTTNIRERKCWNNAILVPHTHTILTHTSYGPDTHNPRTHTLITLQMTCNGACLWSTMKRDWRCVFHWIWYVIMGERELIYFSLRLSHHMWPMDVKWKC